MSYCEFAWHSAICLYPPKKRDVFWRQDMSDSTRRSRLHDVVGLVAEYVVTGLVMLMTLVSTLRILGILS